MAGGKPLANIAVCISSGEEGWAAEDIPAYCGARLALEALSRDRNLPVRLGWRLFDDRGDLARTRAHAQEIAADPTIIGVVGPLGSAQALTSAPAFHAAGLVQVSPSASHPDLCRSGYTTFFRLVANDEAQGRELASAAFDYLGARRAAVVHAEDAWAATLAGIFVRRYEASGGRVVSLSKAVPGPADAAPAVEAILAANPDLVFFAIHPEQGPQVAAALRRAGCRAPFLGTDAMKPSFFLGGGRSGAEAYHTHSGADFRRLPSAAEFRRAYCARFRENSTYSPEGYDAPTVIAEALRGAGSPDRARVLHEMRGIREWPGVSGPIGFDATGERIGAAVVLYRVREHGGRLEMVFLGIASDLRRPGPSGAARRTPAL